MFFLIIQLFKIEYKEDILLALRSCGIERGSTFEGSNLDKALERHMPLFKGLIHHESEKERYSILITSLVDSKERAKAFLDLLREADIDVRKENILRLILVPALMVVDSDIDWEKGDKT